jgi:hypothetical protein
MAPERLDSDDSVGPAADIFAWGAVVTFAATGRTPFQATTNVTMTAQILTSAPHLEGVPTGLRELVRQSLAKDPHQRPTARELLDLLVSNGSPREPAPARTTSSPEARARFKPAVERKRRHVGTLRLSTLILTIVALLAGGAAAVRGAGLSIPLLSRAAPRNGSGSEPGATILDVVDPVGDDHGPGTYRYPSAVDFRAGAFDIERFQVVDAGKTIYLRVTLRNVAATFGKALGAQLLDIFIRDPAASSFSTRPPHPRRNFALATGSAWSSRIVVQGFRSPVFVNAKGASLGAVAVTSNEWTKLIQLAVPTSALGQPRRGWVFTVVLHGQDGYLPDQAREFSATPQPYEFAVCADGNRAAICGIRPSALPKVIDTIAPAGVRQEDELDPTGGPVRLAGIAVP